MCSCASPFRGMGRCPASVLLRRMRMLRLNRSASHQRRFFSSILRHVVDTARTAAQCATSQLGLLSPAMQPYIRLALAVMGHKDMHPALEEITAASGEALYVARGIP